MIGKLEKKVLACETQEIYNNSEQYKKNALQTYQKGIKISEVQSETLTVEEFDELEDKVTQKIIFKDLEIRSIYLVTKKSKSNYSNGYKYIKEFLYSVARSMMMCNAKTMIDNKIAVLGVRTDSLYFRPNDEAKVRQLFPISDKIGEFKIEK
jgi:hypothetical protein